MDTTLAINPGSSSKKYALYRGDRLLCSVLFEEIGEGYGACVEINGTRQRCEDIPHDTYTTSLKEVVDILVREKVINGPTDIGRVGVRVVAPGTFFQSHKTIDDVYTTRLLGIADAAPLHIPHIVSEIDMVRSLLPHAAVVGVSDSAFHSTMPPHAALYSVAAADVLAFGLQRFGYHGISISSVTHQAMQMLGALPARTIVCHIGSGVSVTALKEGKSVDTTMGFSPTSGLVMSSRAGDIDPGALIYLMKKKALTPEAADVYVNSQGGLRGMLGQSDLRIALDRMSRGDVAAQTAIAHYMDEIKKAIGSFVAVLGGVDLLILTATAAERNSMVRERICAGLEGLGIVLDAAMNEERMGKAGFIHSEKSQAKILVVHTNEMEEIARIAETFKR